MIQVLDEISHKGLFCIFISGKHCYQPHFNNWLREMLNDVSNVTRPEGIYLSDIFKIGQLLFLYKVFGWSLNV